MLRLLALEEAGFFILAAFGLALAAAWSLTGSWWAFSLLLAGVFYGAVIVGLAFRVLRKGLLWLVMA